LKSFIKNGMAYQNSTKFLYDKGEKDMTFYAKGSFTGNYKPSDNGKLKKAHYVIGHEFGAPETGSEGAANIAIAQYIADNYAHMPVCASASVVEALKRINPKIKIMGIFRNTSSNTAASKGGTWMELEKAKEYTGVDWRFPILVAQSYHIGRVAKQAEKLGMVPAVPEHLPSVFDVQSTQWWCHNAVLWSLREIPGAIILRFRGEL
jgi:hypothetical protein